jgi:hypothetical protein
VNILLVQRSRNGSSGLLRRRSVFRSHTLRRCCGLQFRGHVGQVFEVELMVWTRLIGMQLHEKALCIRVVWTNLLSLLE